MDYGACAIGKIATQHPPEYRHDYRIRNARRAPRRARARQARSRQERANRERDRSCPDGKLGQIEEFFIEGLTPGDTFLFAGQILRFEGLSESAVLATHARGDTEPKIPSYAGGKFPLSTFLSAARVRELVHDPSHWRALPDQVAEWLMLQQQRSIIPDADQLLVETFPRGSRYHLVCYPFEGRLAHQTLGMLLTRRP